MKGIAEGAAAAGAKWDGRPIDLIDIVTLNTITELGELRVGDADDADRPRRAESHGARATIASKTDVPIERRAAALSPPTARPRATARW